MAHSRRNLEALTAALARYDRVVEVGIGRRTALAAALVERGSHVTATDVHRREVPDGVHFVVDDIVEPTPDVYADAEAIYARNLPPELHRPALEVARTVDADLLFTTLGGDEPTIPVDRVVVGSDTLYLARDAPFRADSSFE